MRVWEKAGETEAETIRSDAAPCAGDKHTIRHQGSAASGLAPAVSPTQLVDMVLDSLASPHSRRAYHPSLGESFTWYPSNASGEGFTRAMLGRYSSHLIEQGFSAASVNLSLAALRKLASEAAAHGGLSPLIAAGIRSVPGARRSGVRIGNWLTLQQAQRLLAEPDPETTKGLRDRVLLGLLVGCGLREGNWRGWSSAMWRNARAAGRSSISSTSTAVSAPSRYRPGPRRRWMAGLRPPGFPAEPCCGVWTRPNGSGPD